MEATSYINEKPTSTPKTESPSFDTFDTYTRKEPAMEFWLDLRGTKVTPQMALWHLARNLPSIDDDDSEDKMQSQVKSSVIWRMVKRILISADSPNENGLLAEHQRILKGGESSSITANSSLQQQVLRYEDRLGFTGVNHENEEEEEMKEIEIDLLFAVEKSSKEEGNKKTTDGVHIYKIHHCEKSVELLGNVNVIPQNPMSAIETLARGEWLVVGKEEKDEANQDLLNFMDIVASGYPSFVDPSSLFLLTKEEEDDDENSMQTNGGGGIAIPCTSNADILQIGASVESLWIQGQCSVGGGGLGGNKRYQQTESGIYVQHNEEVVESKSSGGCIKDDHTMMKYAIILPLDIELWTTASLLGF